MCRENHLVRKLHHHGDGHGPEGHMGQPNSPMRKSAAAPAHPKSEEHSDEGADDERVDDERVLQIEKQFSQGLISHCRRGQGGPLRV